MAATEAEIRDGGEEGGLPRPWSIVFLAVGIGCGLATHLFIEQAVSPAWRFGPPLGLLIGGLAFCLAVPPRRWVPVALAVAGLSLLLAVLATTSALRFGGDTVTYRQGFGSIHLVVEALIVAVIAVPFLQTWHEQGGPVFPYRWLFAHAWNNGLIGALGAAFTLLFWIILWLFAVLFGYVGFPQMEHLVEDSAFAWPALVGAMALGLYAARDYRRVVVALRRIVFSLFSLLSPLFLLLAFGFLVALSLGGFTKLSIALSASGTLIALLVIGVVLFNALLRDGTAETEAGGLLTLCARLMPPALVGLTTFAAYAIYLRIDQHGLTPDRVWIAVTVAVLALHALAYLVSLAWGRRWMTRCRQANIGIAGVVALIALALQTPLADPYRLSAADQYRRLAEGVVDPQVFDYGFLKFELGATGLETLEKIAADSGDADAEVVAQRLAVLATVELPWEWRAQARLPQRETAIAVLSDPQRVRRVPADLEVPADFAPESHLIRDCGRGGRDCLITALELTEAAGEEIVLASRHGSHGVVVHLFERSSGSDGWQATFLHADDADPALWNGLLSGDFAAVPPDHSDLRVGEMTIRLRSGRPAHFGSAARVRELQPEAAEP